MSQDKCYKCGKPVTYDNIMTESEYDENGEPLAVIIIHANCNKTKGKKNG